MAAQYVRLLDPRTLMGATFQRADTAADLGAYNSLSIHFRVLKPGTGSAGGKILLQHAALNEEDAFADLATAEAVVDSTGVNVFVVVTGFLRFVRWRCDATVAGQPVVLIDIVAKE